MSLKHVLILTVFLQIHAIFHFYPTEGSVSEILKDFFMGYSGKGYNQQVVVNIPAYRLTLYTRDEGDSWKTLTIPIGIGKGTEPSNETPTGEGYLYAKETGVIFRYGSENPKNLIGKIIRYSYTFDKKTLKPIKIPMPKDMKSVFMIIYNQETQSVDQQFVLHQTTDWYTVRAPASNGCIRIDEEDMQNFYSSLVPEVKSGKFPLPVPISIHYEIVEYDRHSRKLLLHANIYHKPLNYLDEILKVLHQESIDLRQIDIPGLKWRIVEAETQFQIAEQYIRKKLSQPPFKRLLLDEEKQQLHYSLFLSEVLNEARSSGNEKY